MEDTLRVIHSNNNQLFEQRLNPYCNGRYSTSLSIRVNEAWHNVLILIVMEDTLREFRRG